MHGKSGGGTRCLPICTRRCDECQWQWAVVIDSVPGCIFLRADWVFRNFGLCRLRQLEKYFNCVPALPPKLYDVGSFALAR